MFFIFDENLSAPHKEPLLQLKNSQLFGHGGDLPSSLSHRRIRPSARKSSYRRICPEVSRIKAHMENMQNVRLDLSTVLKPKHLSVRCAMAKELLAGILGNGDPVLAQHAISFLSYVPDPGLEKVLRSRLQRTGDEWSEKHLEMGAFHYLALLN